MFIKATTALRASCTCTTGPPAGSLPLHLGSAIGHQSSRFGMIWGPGKLSLGFTVSPVIGILSTDLLNHL